MSPWLLPSVAVLVGGIAATTDLRSGRIPNWLTFPAIFLGLAANGLAFGFRGCVASLIGASFCAAVPAIVYRASQGQGIGGGDIKLFAALGALLGPTQGLEVELSSFMLLGLFALLRLAYLGQLGRALLTSLRVALGLFFAKYRGQVAAQGAAMTTMRMGPAILLAIVTVQTVPYVVRWLPWLG